MKKRILYTIFVFYIIVLNISATTTLTLSGFMAGTGSGGSMNPSSGSSETDNVSINNIDVVDVNGVHWVGSAGATYDSAAHGWWCDADRAGREGYDNSCFVPEETGTATTTTGPLTYTISSPRVVTTPPDSDGDGVSDDSETEQGTDPDDPNDYQDTDDDGVPDDVEDEDGTDKSNPNDYKDSDGDGASDYDEEKNGTDPETSNEMPIYTGSNPLILNIYTGTGFNFSLSSYFQNATSYSITQLPDWCNFNQYTGVLSGICPGYIENTMYFGNFNASNSNGTTGSKSYNMNVNTVSCYDDFYISSKGYCNAVQGGLATYNILTNINDGVTYSISNNPSWLSLSGNVVSGTCPADCMGFSFTVNASHIEFGSVSKVVTGVINIPNSTEQLAGTSQITNWEDLGSTSWARTMQTAAANTVSQISESNQKLENLNQNINKTNQHLSNLENKQDLTNNNLESLKTKMDTMNNNLTNGLNVNTDNSDIVSSITDLGSYMAGKMDNNNAVLDDIKHALTDDVSSSSDLTMNHTKQINNVDVSSSGSTIQTFFSNQLSHTYNDVQPKFTIPLSALYSDIPDYDIDFYNNDFLRNLVEWIRRIELGGIVILTLYMMWKILKSFEF